MYLARMTRRGSVLLALTSAMLVPACGSSEPETVDAREDTPVSAARPTNWRPPADPCAVLSATARKQLRLQDGQGEKNRCMWLSGPDRSVTDGEIRVLDVRFRPNSGVDGAKIVYRDQSRQAFATVKPTQRMILEEEQLARIGAKAQGADYDAAYWTYSTITEGGRPTGLGEIGLRKGNLVVQIVFAGTDSRGQGQPGAAQPMAVNEFKRTMELLVAGTIDTVRDA